MKKLSIMTLVFCIGFIVTAQTKNEKSGGDQVERIAKISKSSPDYFSHEFKSKKFKKHFKGYKKQFKSFKKGFVGRKAKFRKIGRKTSKQIRVALKN